MAYQPGRGGSLNKDALTRTLTPATPDLPPGWTDVGNQPSAPTVPLPTPLSDTSGGISLPGSAQGTRIPGTAGGFYDEHGNPIADTGGTLGQSSRAGIDVSRYDPDLVRQFDELGTKEGRQWRQDEYDQWLGGYLAKDDINGAGEKIGAWKGGAIDPYWQWRITGHAQGDYNGDNPAYLGEGDMNSNRAKPGGMGGMNANQLMAQQGQAGGMNAALQGSPYGRINAATAKVPNFNIDSLIRQLQGAA